MNKILRYSLVAILAMVFGNVSAQEFVFDFTDGTNPWGFPTEQLKETGTFTKDGKSVVVTTTNYTRWFSDTKVLLFGKKDATLTLPAFDFDVERIDVVGASGASGKVTFNIFVGDEAVSTEVTGAKGTAIFKIAEGKQAAGTVYTIKNTNDNNNQIAKILIWKKGTSGDAPQPTHIENTAETAYTVAEAIAIIDKGEALSETVYVKGIVSQVDSYSDTYHSITYWISDDGTTTNQFEVYSGKGLDGADFASVDDVKVGAKVIIKGKIKKYNTTYEFDKNNELVKYEAPGATTTYKITVTNTEHGNITLDKYEAAAGEKVSVIGMSVDEGYEMNEPTITAENGADVEIGGSDEEGHYIIMPASNVTITLSITQLYTITPVFDSNKGDVRGISFDSEKSPIYKGAGKNVKFTVTAKEGFEVESVTAADADNTPITVNVAADKSYYEFEMPAKDVTITATFKEVQAEEQGQVWDFTQWSDETKSALIADAAASKTSGWSDVEKAADAEAGVEPTEAAKNNCFWFAGTVNEDGSLSANGAVIKELKGLKFDSDYAAKRSLAIAVNYPSTSLGDYAGGAYLWLGGGGSKQTFPCFTIPGVKAGSKITVELESHKPSDGRGIGLYKNSYAAENLIGEQFKPTTKDTKSWDITEDCDVVVWNTSGCHIYTIKVEAGAANINTIRVAAQNGAIYNLAGQMVTSSYKGLVIMNGRKVVMK